MEKLLLVLALVGCGASTGPGPSIDGTWIGSVGSTVIRINLISDGARVSGNLTVSATDGRFFDTWPIVGGVYEWPILGLPLLRPEPWGNVTLRAELSSDGEMVTEATLKIPFRSPIHLSKVPTD